jgi:hypothetical protein
LKKFAMALKDFWLNVRTGARFLTPGTTADSPRLDVASIERTLGAAPVWLTPKSVAGFNPEDFQFLPGKDQKALREAVERFLEVARQLPRHQPGTEQQVQQALPQFARIIEILRPDKYADAQAFVIGKRLEQHLANQIPPTVLELRYETGPDWAGDPALWIWVILKDEATAKGLLLPNARQVRELLEDGVSELGFEHFPHVRVRADSELQPEKPVRKR